MACPLLFQQFVYAVYVVETVVLEEPQLGNDTQLVSHALAQFKPDGLLAVVDIGQHLFAALRREDAQVGGTDAQVGTDPDAGDAHQHAVEQAGLALEDFGQLLLEQP